MFVVIWEYEVRVGSEAAFEALYGAGGAWVKLFGEHPGYLDTQLLLGDQPRRYLTIDRWDSAQAYADFLDAAKARYAQVDRLGDALTLSERCIGRYRTPC